MNIVIVTPELPGITPSGGIGTFVWHHAKLLQSEGEDVLILLACSSESVPSESGLSRYTEKGINVRPVFPKRIEPPAVGAWEFVCRSHGVADSLPQDTDIVYVQDWLADGFLPIRRAHQSTQRRPIFVNIIHSPTAWIREAMGEYPRHLMEDLGRDYAERYVAEHADFVVAPSQYMIDWVRDQGWALPERDKTHVIGYPITDSERGHATGSKGGTCQITFKRLVFLGRYEMRKGIGIFTEALSRLNRNSPEHLSEIEEILFIGPKGNAGQMPPRKVRRMLKHTGKRIRFLQNLNTTDVMKRLQSQARDTLVVIPSLDDNFPYVVIETSLIKGLNVLYSQAGGIPEVLPNAPPDTFFFPDTDPLAKAIVNRLAEGPRFEATGRTYDANVQNAEWMRFHSQVVNFAQDLAGQNIQASCMEPEMDVCIPYFNHGEFLPQVLEALTRQTLPPRSVTLIDDASTDPISKKCFLELHQKYADRNWHFEVASENRGVSAVRNLAATKGSGNFLLFLDADNIPSPNMIERYVTAIESSEDDCLTCYLSSFSGTNPRKKHDPNFLPLGACVPLGMFDNFFGDANFIIRRSVFENLGGFCEDPEWRYSTHEDYEFLLRLVLAGYRLDVVPEVLFHYRVTGNGLINTTNEYRNRLRIQRSYSRLLRDAGLPGITPFFTGMHARRKSLEFLSTTLRQTRTKPWETFKSLLKTGLKRIPIPKS